MALNKHTSVWDFQCGPMKLLLTFLFTLCGNISAVPECFNTPIHWLQRETTCYCHSEGGGGRKKNYETLDYLEKTSEWLGGDRISTYFHCNKKNTLINQIIQLPFYPWAANINGKQSSKWLMEGFPCKVYNKGVPQSLRLCSRAFIFPQ